MNVHLLLNCCSLVPLSALALTACATPRTFANAKPGADGCAQMAGWAREKATNRPAREGESALEDDAREAAACFHRLGKDAQARAALLTLLLSQVPARLGTPITLKSGSFDDSLARTLAAVALSARGHREVETEARATQALKDIRGRGLDLDAGDRTVTGHSSTAVSMLDGDCFFCAKSEIYGANEGEHVDQLGRFAGYPYVRREDGREQFLLNTRLLGEGQTPPRQLFAEAMRRRGRAIVDSTPGTLASRTPAEGEETSPDAPLFRLTLRGFAVGDVASEAGSATGLKIPAHGEQGEILVRFPPKLLQRCGRDRRFVAPADGVDVVVRYEAMDGERRVYRVIIVRVEDGIAEGA